MKCLMVCFGLLCVLHAWTVSLACEGNTFLTEGGSCCDPCAKGEYVLEACAHNGGQTTCKPCGLGTYQDTINPFERCKPCLACQHNTVKTCTETTDAECSCRDGFMCSDEHCSKCELKKSCQPGQTLYPEGTREISYICKPCPDNTYSDTQDGICKPRTRCSDNGFTEVFTGNKTHNSICTPYRDSTMENIKTVVIIMACSVMLLLFLFACVKKTMKHQHANSIALSAPGVSENTPDYPYPKEEIGDKFANCRVQL